MCQFDHLRADGTMLCLLFERNFIRADAVELGGECSPSAPMAQI